MKEGWMMRVVRRAIWEGGGTRMGLGLGLSCGAKVFWGRREAAVVVSLRRPERMWIAAVSGSGRWAVREESGGW